MKADAAAKLDALLRQQTADGHFAAALVARHGVIVLNRAYGQRDGRAATPEDQFWLGGLTDFPAGLLLLMAADQGLVGLDDPVEKYLPPFRGVSVKTPLTIRHLCVHADGLWGHWGDEDHDFEEQIGHYYPYMAVGNSFEYNGAGIALGSKIVEQVTGEALPTLYRRHLLEPLGCWHTSEMANSWDGWSTALDVGRICQMVLNKGAYGNLRFFSEQAYQALLPPRETKVSGADPDRAWGIGTFATEGEGLGKGAFGHWGTASMRIDPSNDLIIVVIGADRGKLINAVVESFVEYAFEDTPL